MVFDFLSIRPTQYVITPYYVPAFSIKYNYHFIRIFKLYSLILIKNKFKIYIYTIKNKLKINYWLNKQNIVIAY